MTRTIVAVLALAAVAGCAGSSGAAGGVQVADPDLGRLGPSQMAPVEEARHFVSSARDELARASLRLQDSQPEAELAKADQVAASADAERAEAEAKAANESRDPAQLERARQLREQARLHKLAADAHVDFAGHLNEANKASVDAANKQVELANARLEWAKLTALQQANIPAATKYDAGKFQGRVADAQKKFDGSLKHARELYGQATASQQRWQDAQRELQANGGGTAVPTGSGVGSR